VREEATGIELVTHFNTALELKWLFLSQPINRLQYSATKEIIYADEYYFEMFPTNGSGLSKQH
jgi:hypothetical protein